jgi:hypothetical protein
MRLLDLPVELLVAIIEQLLEDDELATSLACRRLRRPLQPPSDAPPERGCRRGVARYSAR